ncbi:MAG: CPBP family intramembrane glutamic endopeptidase, partial [Candidatus Rokuibacteriota bacterium]
MHDPDPRAVVQRILSSDKVSTAPTGTPVSGLWIFGAAAAAILVGEVVGLLLAFGLSLPPDAVPDLARVSGYFCGLGVVLALAPRRAWTPSKRVLLPADPTGALRCLVWISIVVGLQLAFDGLVFGRRPPGDRSGSLSAMGWLSALLLAPVIEEIIFRWILLRSVDQLTSFVPAAVVTAAAFSLSHGPQGIDALASHLWFGLLAAVGCYGSGSLLVPMASHCALNYLTLGWG